MENTYEGYHPTLEEQLSRHDSIAEPLERYSLCLREVHDAIDAIHPQDLRDWDYKTQIDYNRNIFPPLYSKLIFYSKCYSLEYENRFSTPDQRKVFKEGQLTMVRNFFKDHDQFCKYYFSGSTWKDSELYTFKNHAALPLNPTEFGIPENVNPGCMSKSCLLAFKDFGELLNKDLEESETQSNLHLVEFKHNDIDIVEMMMGLNASKSINIDGKPATRKQIMSMLETLFNRKIPNWEQLAQSIGNRRKENFTYHKQIIDALEKNQDILVDKKPRQ